MHDQEHCSVAFLTLGFSFPWKNTAVIIVQWKEYDMDRTTKKKKKKIDNVFNVE